MLYLLYFVQQALVGEGSGEEQLFSSASTSIRDSIGSELDGYQQKLKVVMPCPFFTALSLSHLVLFLLLNKLLYFSLDTSDFSFLPNLSDFFVNSINLRQFYYSCGGYR